jgi:phospholipase C
MNAKQLASTAMRTFRTGMISATVFQLAIGSAFAAPLSNSQPSRDDDTATPIKHVIVIVGENRSFDHVFATYVPKKGESVWNLLSEGIVTNTGAPGPNFQKFSQSAAKDQAPDAFLLNPAKDDFQGSVLPAPLVGGPTDSYVKNDSLTLARQSENGLPADYYAYLVTGGSGQTSKTPDARIKNVSALPPGPFQLTNGDTFTYNSYAASPVHRFYQMWQQLDCNADNATENNPSGCDARLFPWVETTVGAGTNGVKQPANFSTEYSSTAVTTGEGSTAMGFYNVQNGDVPYFKQLADKYSMSDNFHQSVNGGTKSKIQTRRLRPTTGTRKMATVADLSDRLPSVAVPIRSAPI